MSNSGFGGGEPAGWQHCLGMDAVGWRAALTWSVGLTEFLDLGLRGVLTERAQNVSDLSHVNLSVALVVEYLERLLKL